VLERSIGSVIGGYRIDDVVGRGGMGVVYRATDVVLERTVALKLVAPELAQDRRFRERFSRELRYVASIDHPNVIPVHHAGDEEGVLFIAMRFVPGIDLRTLVARDGAVEPGRAVDIISQVAAALDAAHARGVVHRDVKPANVLIEDRAGRDHIFLTDFGLSKHTTSAGGLTAPGEFVGTVDYVAPEQIRGESVGERADV
jgi:serine/threonine protein kinase